MNKPNTLLKVTSILYIIFSIISGIVVIVGSLGIGALLVSLRKYGRCIDYKNQT